MSEHIVSGIIKEPAASHCAVGSIHLSGVSPMLTMTRCQCRSGDHDLDGRQDHCLNRVECGRRKCADCRVPMREPEWLRRAHERRLPVKDMTRV